MFLNFTRTTENTTVTLIYFLCVSSRSPAGCQSGTRVHLKHVCGSPSEQEETDLLPLHLRHRHQQHPVRLPRGEGPHLAEAPRRLPLGLRTTVAPL